VKPKGGKSYERADVVAQSERTNVPLYDFSVARKSSVISGGNFSEHSNVRSQLAGFSVTTQQSKIL